MASKVDNESMNSEKLTEHETKQMTIGGPISTITFFRGDREKVIVTIKTRLAAIVKANPWLCGVLVKGNDGLLDLRFPKDPSDVDIANLINPSTRAGKPVEKPVVDSAMDFYSVCKSVGGTSAEVLKGSSCIGNNERLFSCSIIEDAKRPNDTFAMVFSGSHVIMDGHTYYKLLAMLCDGAEVLSLSPTRKQQIKEQSAQAMGSEESKFANGMGVLCNVVGGLLCGSKPIIESFYVDTGKVKNLKQNKTDVDYVSTNDVLTSSFGNALKPDFLLMPLNFREKLPDFTPLDAGNYEGALLFAKGDYTDASSIRRTLASGPPQYERGAGLAKKNPLPGCYGACCGKMGMFISWIFPFFSEIKIEGCQQMLHMPILDVKMVPFDCAVVYRPRAETLAVVYFVRSMNEAAIVENLPMGPKVGSAEQSFAAGNEQNHAIGNAK
jgi:hypothetical protein